MDLTVGVIIGTAFNKIVSSLVSDIVTPLLGLFIGNIEIKSISLGPINIGNFIQSTIDFVVIALVVFLIVKFFSLLRKEKYLRPSVASSPQEDLLREIRDLLKQNKK